MAYTGFWLVAGVLKLIFQLGPQIIFRAHIPTLYVHPET